MPKKTGARRRKAVAPKDLPARKSCDVVGGTTTSTRSGIVMELSDGTTTSSPAPKTSSTGNPIRTASGIVRDFED
jgi:hypothetical protein